MSYETNENTFDTLYTDVILAWRGWYVDEQDFYLTSNNEREPWGLGKTTARCRNKRHSIGEKSPVLSCHCGLYGVFNLPEVPKVKDGDASYLIGLAAYWGKTIIAEKGIRAQYANPYCIIAADKEKHPRKDLYMRFANEAAHVYGISVMTLDEAFLDFEVHLPNNVKRRDIEKEEKEKDFIQKLKPTENELQYKMWQYLKNKGS